MHVCDAFHEHLFTKPGYSTRFPVNISQPHRGQCAQIDAHLTTILRYFSQLKLYYPVRTMSLYVNFALLNSGLTLCLIANLKALVPVALFVAVKMLDYSPLLMAP